MKYKLPIACVLIISFFVALAVSYNRDFNNSESGDELEYVAKAHTYVGPSEIASLPYRPLARTSFTLIKPE